jgi:hypothetical protein
MKLRSFRKLQNIAESSIYWAMEPQILASYKRGERFVENRIR